MDGIRPRLWLVTRGGQSVPADGTARVSVDQAALWGTGRVIAEEHPDLWGGLVDLDPVVHLSTDAALFSSVMCWPLMARTRSHCVRTDVTSCGLLREMRESRPAAFAWRRDATYLITGGLGDVGLHVARSDGGAAALDVWC